MAQVYGHRTPEKQQQTLFGSRLFRLLFCAFLFTAAAVCKNVLPDGYRQALVLGLDSGLTFRDVLEVFGESASSQEVFSRLWNDGVLKVFGLTQQEQEVSHDIADETAAGAQERPAPHSISVSLDLSESMTIPVLMRSEISLDAGVLPAYTTIPGSSGSSSPPPEPAPEEPAEPDEPEPAAVVSEAYRLPAGEEALGLPEVVSTEATAISFAYVTPVLGTLTSDFGYREHPIDGEYKFHYGIDIGVPMRTKVVSFTDGKVIYTGWGDINGNYIKIEHEDGFVTLYAHLDEILVKTGEQVALGELIALSGATGEVSGPHLHFQIYHNEKLIDPGPFLDFAA